VRTELAMKQAWWAASCRAVSSAALGGAPCQVIAGRSVTVLIHIAP
jgi:hypothetical protein